MKLNLKNMILVSFISVAGLFGVGSLALDKQAKEDPVVEKADAASTACDVYFKKKWNNATITQVKVHYWNGGDYWMGMSHVYDDNGYEVYKYTIPAGNSEFRYQIYVSNWGSGEWHTSTNQTVSNNLLCTPSESWSGSNFNVSTGTAYPYTINYKGNGNTSGSMRSVTAYGNVQWGITKNAYARSGYAFTGWNTKQNGSGTPYSDEALLPTKTNTTAVTLYAQWALQVTISYSYYDTNGNSISATPTSSGTKNAGTAYNLPSPSKSGYFFEKWYTDYNSTTHVFSGDSYNAGGSYTPSASIPLYGKFILANTYFIGSFNSWTTDSTSVMSTCPYNVNYKMEHIEFDVNDVFKVRKVSSGSERWYGHSSLQYGDSSKCFTNDSDDNIKCTVAGTYDVYFDGLHVTIFQVGGSELTSGYYLTGTGSFAGSSAGWSILGGMKMVDTSSTPGAKNICYLENSTTGFSISSGSKFKVTRFTGVGSEVSYYNMTTLGGSYDYATIGTDDYGQKYIQITADGNYNFYYGTDYKMYIVDLADIEKAGTLFYTSSKSNISDIKITTVNTESENPFDNVGLDNVHGASKVSTTLKFGNGYVYSIPIFNLRGDDTAHPVVSITLDGSTITITGLGGDSEKYYLDGTTPSETKYAGLAVAIDIDSEVRKASNSSVCNVPKDTATPLCTRYDAIDTAAEGMTELRAATITTYTSTKPTYTGSDDVSMTAIRTQLGNIASGNKAGLAFFAPFDLMGNESNLSTVIIIVSSSVALLSVTALSILVIRKRKSKEQ